jgi:predicted AlkP superfamily phosphohydrolase/phosphomutase
MKTLLIGLDGGTWDIFGPLSDLGEMPNLAKLRANGVWGVLKAPPPANVTASWATLATGVNPGQHGLLGHLPPGRPPADWLRSRIARVNSDDIRSPLLWEYLNAHNLQTGTLNVPLSYPLRPVQGFAISGMFTPPDARDWITPPSLADTLRDYIIDLDYGRPNQPPDADSMPQLPKVLDDILHMTERRGMHTLRLMRDMDWDVFTVVFTGTERIFRYFWHYLQADEEAMARNLDSRIADKLLTYFELLDQIIGAQVKMAGQEARVLLFSSYGYGAAPHHWAHLNNWLLELDLLRLRPGSDDASDPIHPGGPQVTDPARRILNPEARKAVQRYGSLADAIDWQHTLAWAVPLNGNTAGIFLNHQHTENAEGLRAFIKKEAEQLLIPGKGTPLITDIRTREQFYRGDYVEQFPDLILTLNEDYQVVAHLGSTLITPIHPARRIHSGARRPEGMLLATGPFIRRNQRIHPARLIDLAPTILYLTGLPIPETMEGQIIEGLFTPDHLINHPPRSGPGLPFPR